MSIPSLGGGMGPTFFEVRRKADGTELSDEHKAAMAIRSMKANHGGEAAAFTNSIHDLTFREKTVKECFEAINELDPGAPQTYDSVNNFVANLIGV